MAEALCGPSNAVQNLQKHTSVDRTLQQDRTVFRKSTEQGFRSSSPFVAGRLDAEFEAFQAPKALNDFHSLHSSPPPHLATLPQQVLPNWASDFQKLSLHNTKPVNAQFQQPTTLPSATASISWQSEFLAHENEVLQRPTQHHGPQYAPSFQSPYQAMQPFMGNAMNYGSLMNEHAIPNNVSHQELQFDEAAFEQAFNAASAAMENKLESKGKEPTNDREQSGFNMSFACTDYGDVTGDYDWDHNVNEQGHVEGKGFQDVAETTLDSKVIDKQRTVPENDSWLEDMGVHDISPGAEQPRIGSDNILARTQENALSPEAEVDDLSRTAGELIDALKNEHNDKFKQSNFLELMRQLRDKEVRVEGDQMVSVSAR